MNDKCRRGPICVETNAPLLGTPGTLGVCDCADPNKSILILRDSNALGLNREKNSIDAVRKILLSKLGTCDFYKYLSDITPGDKEGGYYWNYGYKYCRRFNHSSLANNPKAARWIDCVTINLQRKILDKCLSLGTDLEKIKKCAYATHASVYTNCGICELDKLFIKQFRILFVPDARDIWSELGFKQLKEALGQCFFRPFLFDTLIDRYTSWWDLKEDQLGRDLAKLAKANPAENYNTILGIMEMLSNTLDDDDVAEEFIKSLTDAELDTLAQTSDGRRILYLMKYALEGGWVFEEEHKQLNRIGNRARR